MKKRATGNDFKNLPDSLESVIAGTHIHWEKGKEQIWAEMERKMESAGTVRTIPGRTAWYRISVAALIALLVGLSAFLTFYTRTITVPAGQHSEVYLPDGSAIKLNARSSISYNPLIWKFSRRIKLEGEAFFSVMKGRKFEVISERGRTTVLGTSFNIFSRKNEYQVTCITGKVKVQGKTGGQALTLDPGQQAYLDAGNILLVMKDVNAEETLSWVNNKFSFASVPLAKVFEEIERQYNVLITFPSSLDYTYTGTFMKDTNVENVLNLVCRPFDLKVYQKSADEFYIEGNN